MIFCMINYIRIYQIYQIRKQKSVNLVTIRLTVPTEELAISICENWQKNNREIYQYLTTALF